MNDIQLMVTQATEAFGRMPLLSRLQDVVKSYTAFQRWQGVSSLKEGTSQLLVSLIQLCNDQGWDIDELVGKHLPSLVAKLQINERLIHPCRIGIMYGAFDPPTIGHIYALKHVLERLSLDEIWMVPCLKHPRKVIMASLDLRLRMCEIATRNDPRIVVANYEKQAPSEGIMYNFAQHITTQIQGCLFYFIISLNNAIQIQTWTNPQELLNFPFVVVGRSGYKKKKVDWYKKIPHFDLTDYHTRSTSSQEVRRIFREKIDEAKLKTMMDSEVVQFIRETKAYKQPLI